LGGGLIVVVGWPGQWLAEFVRDDGQRLRVRAGQEQTHFTLHPGEEVRGPLVVLQFHDGDWIRVEIDCRKMEGSLHWLGGSDRRYALNELEAATQELNQRTTRSSIKPHPKLPDDTRLWAALQKVSGGAWGGSVYDVDAIIQALNRE